MSDPHEHDYGGRKHTTSADRVRAHRRREAPDHSPERRHTKGNYRVFLKDHDGKKCHSYGETQESTEKTRSRGKDRHEPQEAHRMSLPMKSTRFGNIFGSMRVSDKMRREKISDVLGKKGTPHSKPPFRPTASKLPEQLQRFLQEPSLVSFGNARETDDLAWLEADSTMDGGVSERLPLTSPKTHPKPAPHREPRHEQAPSPISEHPSQQSTQLRKRDHEAARQRNRPSRKEAHLISRATSPIVAMPLHFLRQPRRPACDEGVQVQVDSVGSGSIGSAALSAELNLNVNEDRADDFCSPTRSHLDSLVISPDGDGRKTRTTQQASSWTEKAERVVLDTGEIAYLVKPSTAEMDPEQQLSQPRPVNSRRSAHREKSQRRISQTSWEQDNPRGPRMQQQRTKSAAAHCESSSSSLHRHRTITRRNTENFEFNPNPVFSDPLPPTPFFQRDVEDKFGVPTVRVSPDDPVTAALDKSQGHSRAGSNVFQPTFGTTQVENTSFSKYFDNLPCSRPSEDVESILAEYRNIRGEMHSRMQCQIDAEPNRGTLQSGSESGRKTSAARVYPRRMF